MPMLASAIDIVILIFRSIRSHIRWMTWNLFLAIIPLLLSVWLFRQQRSRTWLWWLGLLAFIAFLPNAPYVLTDIIHLIYDIRQESSIWMITLVVVPQYLLFMLIGFGAYVLSLINLGYYLQQQGLRRWIFPAELFLHTLSAVGVYLGRFERFNSWDFVTQPDAVVFSTFHNLMSKRPAFVMIISLFIITSLYWVMKQIILAVLLRKRYGRVLERLDADSESSGDIAS